MNLKDATASRLAAGSAAVFKTLRHVRVSVTTKDGHIKVTLDIPLGDIGKA